MEIDVRVMPVRDSYNSDCEDMDFTIRKREIELQVGDRNLVFDQKDIERLVSLCYTVSN